MRKQIWPLVLLGFAMFQGFSQSVIVNSNPTMNDRFSKRLGSLRLSTTMLNMGRIKNNASKTDTIQVYNAGTKNMSLSVGKVPPHMEVSLGTLELHAGKESWIVVTYDAMKKNDFGYVLDRFDILTNDSAQSRKTISVSAHIQEYFSPMTSEDSLTIQKGKWAETVFDYGKIKQGTKSSHSFLVTNEGKRDLMIRKTHSNCSCIKITSASDTIATGQTAILTVEFDSANKQGKDSRKVHVFVNDPARPEVVLEMKGEIVK